MITSKCLKPRIRILQKEENLPYELLLLADDTAEAINRYIFTSDIYVLELEGIISAVYALQYQGDFTVEIKNIAVLEDLHNQGIGTFLLKDAIRRVKLKGMKSVLIGTGDASYGPLYLYQKIGFKIFDSKKDFFIENYPHPVIENGKELIDMIMLKLELR